MPEPETLCHSSTVLRELWDHAAATDPNAPLFTMELYEDLGRVHGAIARKAKVIAEKIGERTVVDLLIHLVALEPNHPHFPTLLFVEPQPCQ